MTSPVRAPRFALLLGALLPFVVNSAPAQDRVRAATDTVADSLKARSDTLSDTDRLLLEQLKQRVQLRALPLTGVSGLLPGGSRQVFTRDSIDWAPAQTVSDLLALVPGVFVQRGGWLGRPELPGYMGRGAAAIEYSLDGIPYMALGPDSAAVDPSFLALSLLERVEVEHGPGLLRVALFSRRHERQAPRTQIGVMAGDQGIARYLADYERRYPNGFGVGLLADYFSVNAPDGVTGASNALNLWTQVGWVPSAKFGVQAQILAQLLDRDALVASGSDETAGDTISPIVKGNRTDFQLRGSFRQQSDGLGGQVDLFAAQSAWSSDSLHQDVAHFGGTAAWRRPTWSAQLTAWHHSEWTPFDARLSLGWAPKSFVSGSIAQVTQHHAGDRNSSWVEGRVGLLLPFGVSLNGVVRDGQRVQSPSVLTDPEQRFTDIEGTAGISWRRLGLEAGYTRNDDWIPIAFRQFLAIPVLRATPEIEWLTIRGRLTPINWFTIATHYEQPLKGAIPDGQPPKHSYTTATIRSRFLRNFPSGIFGLKVQGVVENWGAGVIGRDSSGVAIPMPGSTYLRGSIQFQIGSFFAYYDRVNLTAVKTGYVPGYPVAGLGSTFGVRWEFSN